MSVQRYVYGFSVIVLSFFACMHIVHAQDAATLDTSDLDSEACHRRFSLPNQPALCNTWNKQCDADQEEVATCTGFVRDTPCCRKTAAPAASAGGTSGGANGVTAGAGSPTVVPVYSGFSLYNFLPAKVKTCWVNGDCGIDDIVRTGVAFATLLTTLSGAAFFATFIYGGALYLMSFGSAKMVSKAKGAMSGAAIGMIIVMSAWTIVNYLASTLVGKST